MEGFRYIQFYFVFQGRESEIFRDILSEGKLMGRDTAIRSNMTRNFFEEEISYYCALFQFNKF